MKEERPKLTEPSSDPKDKTDYREFAAPFGAQYWLVQKRIFEQYWRTPSYIYSKLILCAATGLFIGFSFYKAPNTQQGIQNQLFGIFMLLTLFSQLVQQIMPLFVTQRSLYEARERPSKTYSWKAFMLSNMLVELPWATLAAVVMFFTWYYPIGLYNNALETNAVALRGAQVFLFIWQFILFASTFAHMIISGVEMAETAGNIANLLFSMCLLFCGVLVGPTAMPGFWIFMYRISPFTYLVEGILSGAVANTGIQCADNEYLRFEAPQGSTCGRYLAPYLQQAPGYLVDDNTTSCKFCPIDSTNDYLAAVSISYSHIWRDFGIMFVFIGFNILAALGIYWLARVPKNPKKRHNNVTPNEDGAVSRKTTREQHTADGEKTV
jgi:ATP-binding cassette subfamily G (WHITE) protein 2 (PDR)